MVGVGSGRCEFGLDWRFFVVFGFVYWWHALRATMIWYSKMGGAARWGVAGSDAGLTGWGWLITLCGQGRCGSAGIGGTASWCVVDKECEA